VILLASFKIPGNISDLNYQQNLRMDVFKFDHFLKNFSSTDGINFTNLPQIELEPEYLNLI
jgi:hypothetical protein